MKSLEIKTALSNANIPYWKVGNALGISENTVWRMLREDEVPNEKGKLILSAIKQIQKER